MIVLVSAADFIVSCSIPLEAEKLVLTASLSNESAWSYDGAMDGRDG